MRSLRHAVCWLLLSLLACGHALAAEPSTPAKNPPAMNEIILRYGISGSMGTKPGQRDAVVVLLLRDVEELKAVGCDPLRDQRFRRQAGHDFRHRGLEICAGAQGVVAVAECQGGYRGGDADAERRV